MNQVQGAIVNTLAITDTYGNLRSFRASFSQNCLSLSTNCSSSLFGSCAITQYHLGQVSCVLPRNKRVPRASHGTIRKPWILQLVAGRVHWMSLLSAFWEATKCSTGSSCKEKHHRTIIFGGSNSDFCLKWRDPENCHPFLVGAKSKVQTPKHSKKIGWRLLWPYHNCRVFLVCAAQSQVLDLVL